MELAGKCVVEIVDRDVSTFHDLGSHLIAFHNFRIQLSIKSPFDAFFVNLSHARPDEFWLGRNGLQQFNQVRQLSAVFGRRNAILRQSVKAKVEVYNREISATKNADDLALDPGAYEVFWGEVPINIGDIL